MAAQSTPRTRGRKGVELRKKRLQREPLCRHCAAKGLTVIATTPDHIVPLAHGGTDTDDNIQCLCKDCHETKTAYESHGNHAAINHPAWLRPSAIPLEIVAGPPASGKTTYVNANAKSDDVIISLDDIMMQIDPHYRHWSAGLSKALFNRAIRVRNALLGSLERRQRGRAWFIVSAPTKAEREWWQAALGGTITLLDPGPDECKRRALARGTPKAVAGIVAWYRNAKSPWQPHSPKPKGPTTAEWLAD